jgi:hypothetical protein
MKVLDWSAAAAGNQIQCPRPTTLFLPDFRGAGQHNLSDDAKNAKE